MKNQLTFKQGIRAGMPICMGYIPVSFAFGIRAVALGIPGWGAILTSLTNLTSAGQYAGIELIAEHCAMLELGITVLIINLRYMLMSLAISQKVDPAIPVWQRMIFSFGITDETFVIASLQKAKLSSSYMMGLITTPILGWNLGTVLGVIASNILPGRMRSALGIALYAMFIALIVPPAREDRKVLVILLVSVALSCLMYYLPALAWVSSGMRIIFAAVIAAGIGAYFFPRKEEAS